jgi:hypothetical protein
MNLRISIGILLDMSVVLALSLRIGLEVKGHRKEFHTMYFFTILYYFSENIINRNFGNAFTN